MRSVSPNREHQIPRVNFDSPAEERKYFLSPRLQRKSKETKGASNNETREEEEGEGDREKGEKGEKGEDEQVTTRREKGKWEK